MLVGRGLHTMPFLKDGNLVVYAVDRDSNFVAERQLPPDRTVAEVKAELRAELDAADPQEAGR